MPARRFATSLFCGVFALASAEFSGNALAQTAAGDGTHMRDICAASACQWTGLADVVSTGSLRFAPFGWHSASLPFEFDGVFDKSNVNSGHESGRSRLAMAAGLGVVGAAAIFAATTSGADHGVRLAPGSGPAVGMPIAAVTLDDAVTATPEPTTLVLIATGFLLLFPIARAIRSR